MLEDAETSSMLQSAVPATAHKILFVIHSCKVAINAYACLAAHLHQARLKRLTLQGLH